MFVASMDPAKEVGAEVDAFLGTAPQFDDLTMLAVKYNGPSPGIRDE